jgi:hypothetical protein
MTNPLRLILIVLLSFAAGWLSRPTPPAPSVSPTAQFPSIDVPHFDGAYLLPETGVTVRYPTAGFYGLGAAVHESGNGDPASATIVPVDDPARLGLSTADAVSLEVTADPNVKARWATGPGESRLIDGRPFVIFTEREDVSTYVAQTAHAGRIITVTLIYKTTADQPSENDITHARHRQLFERILADMDFDDQP